MKISEIFNLGVNQMQLDFVNVDTTEDCPLFIDPHLISQQNGNWALEADRTIKNFFTKFINYIIEDNYIEAEALFVCSSEPKETCLGLSSSGTENGKGVGSTNAHDIVTEIVESNAIELGVLNNIEDILVFVDNIGRDKISDLVTNLIRKHLIEYTIQQCEFWDLPTETLESMPYWNPIKEGWEYGDYESLTYSGRQLILVPKSIVSPLNEYCAEKYNWHYVVTQERDVHLMRKSSLVRYRKLKDGSEKAVLSKREVNDYIKGEIESGKYLTRKEYLRIYTNENPELFERFKEDMKRKNKLLTDDEFYEYTSECDINELIDELIAQLESIPTGTKDATNYHYFIKCILEILFYPNLVRPTVEERIHQGRKRIDIMMENVARRGYFHRLHDIHKIQCQYVAIECKNYTKDIANNELDQLSSRFSFNRGKFGILMCRRFDNKELFYQRCSDTYKDDRGLIIPLDDEDIIRLLTSIKSEDDLFIDNMLSEIQKKIIVV